MEPQHNVLITGASGYLGGSLMHRLTCAELPPHTLYALVRTDSQAEAVQKYGATPLSFNISDDNAVRDAVLRYEIDVVFWLIDARTSTGQERFIRALAELKRITGKAVHFLHTSGAKLFSEHAGAPVDQEIRDDEPGLSEMQKTQRAPVLSVQSGVDANNKVISLSEELGVRSYVFVPCIVYGQGEGFGKPVSKQTVAVVSAAQALKRVYKVDQGRPDETWPVCHIVDVSALYVQLLSSIIAEKPLGYGKNGYYLASSGSVAWDDIYSAVAKAMIKRGLVENESVAMADNNMLEKMAGALGCPREMVKVSLGGSCQLTARHGGQIGWKPQYPAEYITEAMDDEVELIIASMGR